MTESFFKSKDKVKFPRISTKPRSLPGENNKQLFLDEVSAKSWIYYTPTAQYGKKLFL